jgi:hypothetical protein
VYTLLNNAESSKFDLYLPGKLVAALHYKIEEDKNEVMLIYCEAIEPREPVDHCQRTDEAGARRPPQPANGDHDHLSDRSRDRQGRRERRLGHGLNEPGRS